MKDLTDGYARRKYKQRLMSKLQYVVLHRCAIADSGSDVIWKFENERDEFQAGSYTGGKRPYHFYIPEEGYVEQHLPISLVAPGAGTLNLAGIQVALHGDFRKAPPNAHQIQALCGLICRLEGILGRDLQIVGHTSRPGTTRSENKECPGSHLNPDEIAEMRRGLHFPVEVRV